MRSWRTRKDQVDQEEEDQLQDQTTEAVIYKPGNQFLEKVTGKLCRQDPMGGSLQYKDGVFLDESGRRVDKTFRQRGFTGNLNEREKAFQKFLNYRKPVRGFGFSKFFEGPMQAFSDFNASINRPYFEKCN